MDKRKGVLLTSWKFGYRGGSYQDCAENYREKIPGGERGQEKLVLVVVTEINRDVKHEGFVLIGMNEDNQYYYLSPKAASRDSS